ELIGDRRIRVTMGQAGTPTAGVGDGIAEQESNDAVAGVLIDMRELVREKAGAGECAPFDLRGRGAGKKYPVSQRDGIRPENPRQRARQGSAEDPAPGRRARQARRRSISAS